MANGHYNAIVTTRTHQDLRCHWIYHMTMCSMNWERKDHYIGTFFIFTFCIEWPWILLSNVMDVITSVYIGHIVKGYLSLSRHIRKLLSSVLLVQLSYYTGYDLDKPEDFSAHLYQKCHNVVGFCEITSSN